MVGRVHGSAVIARKPHLDHSHDLGTGATLRCVVCGLALKDLYAMDKEAEAVAVDAAIRILILADARRLFRR
jgi:hypothetical protein